MEQQAVAALVFDARGAQKGAADTVAAAERIIAATKPLQRVFSPIADEADKATRRIVKSTSDQTRAFDALIKRMDPLGESVRRAQRDVDMLSRAMAQGGDAANRAAGVWENAQRRLQAAQRAASGGIGGGSGGQDMRQTAAEADRAGASFGVFATRAVAVGAAVYAAKQSVEAFVGGIARASDQVNQLTARLNVLTGAQQGSRDAFDQVYQIAQRTGVALADAGTGYSRLAIAAGEFGATNQQVAVVVDTLTKLGRVAGGSTAEVTAGVQQLGQALSSGVLQGDELRSIRENLPLVARAIAKEFGVGIGELKRLGEEGRLTADRVFSALQKANAEATRQFAELPQTVEQASTRVANAMTLVTAEFGKWTGLAEFFVNRLNQAAGIIEIISRGIGVLNNPAFRDRAEAAQVDKELVDLRARQGRPRSFVGDLLGGSPSELNERIAALEARRRAIDVRAADRDYDAGVAANNQTFDGMARAAAATQTRRTAAMVEVDKVRATYDPLIKLQRDLAEAKKHYDAAVASGAITQAHANEELDKYRRHLLAAGAAGKETAKSVEALAEATAAADFSGKLADAAYSGAAALAEIEAQAQAAKKAMDLFGGRRDAAFEGRFSAALLADRQNKAAREFRESTLGIERENQLLQRQLELIGQRPEVVDREIALLKVKLDLESRGVTMSAEDVRRRVEAITVQERLTRETEESRRAAEQWAEPFKNAIQGIQSTFTDFFEKVLSGGIRSFGDLADSAKRIWFRMIAEMASAAIIRPVIQFAVGGASSLGLIGPQTAQALGGGGASSGGGFNPFGIFGQGGFDGMLGRVGSFLGSPISGFPSAAAFEGVLGTGTSGAAAQQYFNGASGGGLFGTTTWGQGLGALAGVGSSIFSFASGNPIGGAAGLLGAGVSLIPGIGQIAGPAIGILGGILGSLFKSKPDIKAQSVHDFNPATGRYGSRVTFAQGASAPVAPGIGNDALKFLSGFGGGVGAGQMAPSYYTWAGFEDGRFDASTTGPLFQSFYDAAVGTADERQMIARRRLWTDAGDAALPIEGVTKDSEGLMKQLQVLILKTGVRSGAFSGLSDTSQTIIRNAQVPDLQELGGLLEWGRSTYDTLIRGDAITEAEKALTALKQSFEAATRQAADLGLATDGLVSAQSKAVRKYAEDFQQSISDRILGITDPAGLQRAQLDREFERLRKEAEYLNSEAVRSLTGTLIDINELERAYGLERERIVSQQLDGLLALQKRLLFGDLSGATPADAVTGAGASYDATLAQARAGSGEALARLSGVGADFVSASQAAYGHTAQFASTRDRVLADIGAIIGSGGMAGGGAANGNAMSADNVVLLQTLVQQQSAQIAVLMEQNAQLIAQFKRAS